MNWFNRDDIHVSRDSLVAFAWSARMRDLAIKVGLWTSG